MMRKCICDAIKHHNYSDFFHNGRICEGRGKKIKKGVTLTPTWIFRKSVQFMRN